MLFRIDLRATPAGGSYSPHPNTQTLEFALKTGYISGDSAIVKPRAALLHIKFITIKAYNQKIGIEQKKFQAYLNVFPRRLAYAKNNHRNLPGRFTRTSDSTV
jgi:hypothetical protein